MSAVEGCEAAVTARTRCGWVMLRKCGEIQKKVSSKVERGRLHELCKVSNSVYE